MKRDRRLLATSAFALLFVLPMPGYTFAAATSVLPQPGENSSQVDRGQILLAQNDQSPEEDKKHRRHREGEGGEQQPNGNHGEQGRPARPAPQGEARGHGPQGGEEGAQPERRQQRHHQDQEHGQPQNPQGGQTQAPRAVQPEARPEAQPAPDHTVTERRHKGHERHGDQNQAPDQTQPKPSNRGVVPQRAPETPPAAPGATPPAKEVTPHHRKHRDDQQPAKAPTPPPSPAERPANGAVAPTPPQPTPQPGHPQHAPVPPNQGEAQGGGNAGAHAPQLPEQNGMQQPRPNFHHGGNGTGGNGAVNPNGAPASGGQRRSYQQGARQPGQNGAVFGPAPHSDGAAQTGIRRPERIESIDAIHGRRVDRDQLPPRERPKGAEVLKQVGNQVLIQMGTQMIVQSREPDERLRHGARNVYYEDLPDNRTRETIMRPDGSRIITIRDAYGDIIRRSRILPDGRELVLVYVDNRDLERDRDDGWRDPGADLPPFRLTVPEDDYILDASGGISPNRYYEFLDQPPVERIPRLYTIGEVKRSARIRAMVPRIDLDTINFSFGSAQIDQSEVGKLKAVAEAMQRILKRNPAETFLIEGHTDAVGTPQSNLILSNQRAESVASALTNSFDIPPENLTTQGYGEEDLKVDTQAPNRQNRRVTIRRITPLIAPVASAQ